MAPDIAFERPYLYPKQEEAFFCDERYGITEASTKSGKTLGALAWLMEQAFMKGKPGRNYWWVAPVHNQALIAYRRAKRALPDQVYTSSDTRQEISLINGATMVYKSGEDPDNLYGEDVDAAVIDEASRLREESWHAVRSTLTATRGPIRIIGNVQGRRNWFYRLARRAEAGEPDMHYAKITVHDAVAAGVFPEEEMEDAKRTLPAEVYRELYEAEPGDESGNPFGFDAIRDCALPALSSKDPKVWGWDLAKSQDYTVGYALDEDLRACRFERFQKPWMETISTIKRLTGNTPALVDSTGVGDPILEALQRGAYNFEGYKFSDMSRQQLMEGLAAALQMRRIGYLDGVTRHELESFEYEYRRSGVRYVAGEGAHDDTVMGLALALAMAAKRHVTGVRSLRLPAGQRAAMPSLG